MKNKSVKSKNHRTALAVRCMLWLEGKIRKKLEYRDICHYLFADCLLEKSKPCGDNGFTRESPKDINLCINHPKDCPRNKQMGGLL